MHESPHLPKRRFDPETGRLMPPRNTYATLDIIIGSALMIGAGAALIATGTYLLPKAEQLLEELMAKPTKTNYFTQPKAPVYLTAPHETHVHTYRHS